MIDIGVNLTNKRFDKDRETVIERAKNAGINTMLVTGTSIAESQKALQLTIEYPNELYATAGVHPHDADHVSSSYLDELKNLAQQKAVVAIGECGLDFNRNFSTPENQRNVFAEQIALAHELNMPLFLHQRDAFKPWYDLLAPYFNKIPAMVSHCFTGSREELELCLAAGMFIGITGWVCDERRGQPLRNIIPNIPLNRLMIETDSPYLTPRNIRPKPKSSRNEPAYLPFIVKELAELYQCNPKDIIEASEKNTRQVFKLGANNED